MVTFHVGYNLRSCHVFRRYSWCYHLTGDDVTLSGTMTMGWWCFLYCCFAKR